MTDLFGDDTRFASQHRGTKRTASRVDAAIEVGANARRPVTERPGKKPSSRLGSSVTNPHPGQTSARLGTLNQTQPSPGCMPMAPPELRSASVIAPATIIADDRQADLFPLPVPDSHEPATKDEAVKKQVAPRAPASIPSAAKRPKTLWACLQFLETCPDLPPSLLTDARSAVSALDRIVTNPDGSKRRWLAPGTRAGTTIPADPRQLRPILDGIALTSHHLSSARVNKIRSAINVMLKHCGWIHPAFWAASPQDLAYERLLSQAYRHLKLQAGPLGPAFRFWQSLGLRPEDVRNEHAIAYLQVREAACLHRRPRSNVENVLSAWNRMIALAPDWPQTELHLASRFVAKAPRRSELRAEVLEELKLYETRLATGTEQDDDANDPICASSVYQQGRWLLRAIGVLTSNGLPIEHFDRLSLLTEPDRFWAVMLALRKEFGNTWSPTSRAVGRAILTLARRWVRPGPATLDELARLLRRMKQRRRGLSNRNLERLDQFDTPAKRKMLLELPDQVLRKCQDMIRREGGVTRQIAHLSETALALKILFVQPLRAENLAKLGESHFRRNARGMIHEIRISAEETKTRNRRIEVEASFQFAAQVEWHWKNCRPLLAYGSALDLPHLFLGPKGKARRPQTLGKSITALVAQELGMHFTPHMARHLIVTMLLDEDPNNMAVASRMLGHTDIKTTQQIYGVVQNRSAQKVWERVADGLRNNAAKREAPPRRAKIGPAVAESPTSEAPVPSGRRNPNGKAPASKTGKLRAERTDGE